MRPSALLADSPNPRNVTISRARGKLLIVAAVAYFRASDPDGLVTALLGAAAQPLSPCWVAIRSAAGRVR